MCPRSPRFVIRFAALLGFVTTACWAQFSGSIQGTVTDPAGSVVPNAKIQLKNTETTVTATTASDAEGNYRFVSLAPGSYQLTVDAKGFNTTAIPLTLETSQNLNVPVSMKVASSSQTVEVSGEVPVLNTAETRNQMTLETSALSELPLAGRNMISLVTLAPGVIGIGTVAAGSPGSGVDNYSTELQVDASANGLGSVANMYIVDGLDVTSAIRPGVLNLTPNPDSVQEVAIQTNTFNVEYGRASSLQMAMTTKSGTDGFHGTASDYFTNQKLFAGTEFVHNYSPYHSNNISATIGGPIIPHHEFFFFFSIEPLRASTSTGNSTTTFEDPQFVSWAKQNFPNTLGTKILTSYPASNATTTGVLQTAAQVFPGTCGTATTSNLPCSTPMIDSGIFNGTNYRNGTQFNVRADKYFKNDRIYGNVYRTVLDYGGPAIRPAFAATNHTILNSYQFSETHTFSPTLVNEASFGYMRDEGITPQTGLFSVPLINVTGQGTGFGNGFALGDFIQHNYHWRDVLTNIRGSHTLKFGYEGWFGDDVEDFQGPHAQPTFQFNNLLDLVQDNPYTETGVAYNPITGKPVLWDWNAASKTFGLFAQDIWKAKPNLTLTYGIRFDDFGNPYSRSTNTVFGNFILGQGSDFNQQVANGKVVQNNNVFNSAQKAWSPRLGISWDPNKKGDWVIRGGVGIFHNWVTPANAQEEFRGNPPGPIYPTFFNNGAIPPLFVLGSTNTPPFGFTYPVVPPGQLDSHGGVLGLQPAIGAVDPNLKTPVSYNFTGTVERKLTRDTVVSIGYTGAVSRDLLSGGGQQYSVSYGVDINAYAGDLVQHNSTIPTRLVPSFGQIYYTQNDRQSRFDAMTIGVRTRFAKNGFINAYYTRSDSRDDVQVYPVASNPMQYYGPSIWDSPNRLSLTWSYTIPGVGQGHGVVGRMTSGWTASGTTILQSGHPFTVNTTAAFIPLKDANGNFIGLAPNSGDYNADGDNNDYPNVTSYAMSRSRQGFLTGVFPKSNFVLPAMGTEGNEKWGQFRNPGFAETDAALQKDTKLMERLLLELRFEFFNLFNRVNLGSVNSNLSNATFGRATSQLPPRWIQIGAKIIF
ncbi:MAG TPA: TonB-dependent receptor [Bryobacteraceae bacterium]|nr:TonB-dependent receptor [Bryobacteraceae bacterium]